MAAHFFTCALEMFLSWQKYTAIRDPLLSWSAAVLIDSRLRVSSSSPATAERVTDHSRRLRLVSVNLLEILKRLVDLRVGDDIPLHRELGREGLVWLAHAITQHLGDCPVDSPDTGDFAVRVGHGGGSGQG
jgi:hypothetical protein